MLVSVKIDRVTEHPGLRERKKLDRRRSIEAAALNRFEQIFWSGQSLEDLYRTLSDRNTEGMGAIFVAAMKEWKKSFEKGARSPIGR